MIGKHLKNMGHGHDAHPGMKIPSAESYKLSDAPELVKLQEKLAKKGLHDPWLRNHVWRYNPKYGTETGRWFGHLFRGFRVGLAAFVITIAVEKALGIDYGHGHHEEHKEGEHH